MVDDYDYLIDDVDLALMYMTAQRIHDEWYDAHTLSVIDEEDQEDV